MIKDELKKMSEDQLFDWFCENARHVDLPTSPTGDGYKIMVGAKLLHDRETDKLLEKVKEYINS